MRTRCLASHHAHRLGSERDLTIDAPGIGFKIIDEEARWGPVLDAIAKASNAKTMWCFVQKESELRLSGLALVSSKQFIIQAGSSVEL